MKSKDFSKEEQKPKINKRRKDIEMEVSVLEKCMKLSMKLITMKYDVIMI